MERIGSHNSVHTSSTLYGTSPMCRFPKAGEHFGFRKSRAFFNYIFVSFASPYSSKPYLTHFTSTLLLSSGGRGIIKEGRLPSLISSGCILPISIRIILQYFQVYYNRIVVGDKSFVRTVRSHPQLIG